MMKWYRDHVKSCFRTKNATRRDETRRAGKCGWSRLLPASAASFPREAGLSNIRTVSRALWQVLTSNDTSIDAIDTIDQAINSTRQHVGRVSCSSQTRRWDAVEVSIDQHLPSTTHPSGDPSTDHRLTREIPATNINKSSYRGQAIIRPN